MLTLHRLAPLSEAAPNEARATGAVIAETDAK
jgi:hypothetical protein